MDMSEMNDGAEKDMSEMNAIGHLEICGMKCKFVVDGKKKKLDLNDFPEELENVFRAWYLKVLNTRSFEYKKDVAFVSNGQRGVFKGAFVTIHEIRCNVTGILLEEFFYLYFDVSEIEQKKILLKPSELEFLGITDVEEISPVIWESIG